MSLTSLRCRCFLKHDCHDIFFYGASLWFQILIWQHFNWDGLCSALHYTALACWDHIQFAYLHVSACKCSKVTWKHGTTISVPGFWEPWGVSWHPLWFVWPTIELQVKLILDISSSRTTKPSKITTETLENFANINAKLWIKLKNAKLLLIWMHLRIQFIVVTMTSFLWIGFVHSAKKVQAWVGILQAFHLFYIGDYTPQSSIVQ